MLPWARRIKKNFRLFWSMKIKIKKHEKQLRVNLEKLRPKNSYKNLIKKRTHSIDEIIKKHGKIPNELLINRNCPNCSGDSSKKILHKDHLDIVQCSECQLIYVSPIFNEEHYRKSYESEEYENIVKELGFGSHEYRCERFGEERVKLMEAHLGKKICPKDIKYLDIGCSTGFVVEAAQKNGWDAQGIDLNKSAINFGKSRNLNLEYGDLFDMKFTDNSFDVISAFDVLEHIVSPASIVKKIYNLLKPNGIAYFYVPNWDSASRILMNHEAHFIWPTHHLTYFTPDTLCKFFKKRKLKTEHLETEGLDIFDFIWRLKNDNKENTELIEKLSNDLQFFINSGGWGKNLRCLVRK
ncbi:hypothetical protein CMI37_16115 [Candidatus Pacearchaeota archaeon]|nr:hypothetical protein [Candidatus Pacearchaeota archaeon]